MRRLEHFDDLRRKANLYQTVLQAQVEGLAENLTEMERQVHGLLDSKKGQGGLNTGHQGPSRNQEGQFRPDTGAAPSRIQGEIK